MTAIIVEEKCKQLGIDPDAYDSATRKEIIFLSKHELGDSPEHFAEYKNFMTHDELVAIIRWNNLHKCYPQYFTWDGPVEG